MHAFEEKNENCKKVTASYRPRPRPIVYRLAVPGLLTAFGGPPGPNSLHHRPIQE